MLALRDGQDSVVKTAVAKIQMYHYDRSSSGILLMPRMIPEDEQSYHDLNIGGRREDNDNILLFYFAQIFLRKRLNQIHREM